MIGKEMEAIPCPTTIFPIIMGKTLSAFWNGCRLLTLSK